MFDLRNPSQTLGPRIFMIVYMSIITSRNSGEGEDTKAARTPGQPGRDETEVPRNRAAEARKRDPTTEPERDLGETLHPSRLGRHPKAEKRMSTFFWAILCI